MLARGIVRPLRRITGRAKHGPRSHSRSYVSHSEPAPIQVQCDSSTAALRTLINDFDKFAPRFDVEASQITILETPSEFYATLKHKISQAKNHIFLSTLYIGANETDLVETLRRSLRANPNLRLSVLTDLLRSSRDGVPPDPSAAPLLLALFNEFPDRVHMHMYHTPNLNGWKKKLLPPRINEGWGLQHMKLYGFDDEIMLSGANLSSDYFTNRQDRYHLISSPEVTRYYRCLHDAVCNLSFKVVESSHKGGQAVLDWKRNASIEPVTQSAAYIKTATRELAPLIGPQRFCPTRATDTQIYPLCQFTPIMKPDKSTELVGLKILLGRLANSAFSGSRWTFTAGYFNMTDDIRARLLATNPISGTVIAASPWANGFYGSRGLSGMLPAAYTSMARRFLENVSKLGLSDKIKLKEWRLGTVNQPGGWTYHAKGLWLTLPNQKEPSVTLIGSSNYTQRSYSLDLEANALIVTTNPDLTKRLAEEEVWLQKHAKEVDKTDFEKTERRVGIHVRVAMQIVKLVGGAL